MNTNLQRSYSLPKNRFGHLSKNMFFARHVAQPRYLKFITGAVGQRICHVREEPLHIPVSTLGVRTKPLMSDPQFNIEFSPNSHNEALLRSYTERIQPKQRRERLLPPIPGWNPSGTVVEDTDNWRRELARIAEMVGLVTPDELVELETRKETPPQTSLPSSAKSAITTGQYSRQSGRWNETPKSASRSGVLRRRTPLKSVLPTHLFCVDEQEREMWMLQVLCQILQTENLNEIQSWLVSSGPGGSFYFNTCEANLCDDLVDPLLAQSSSSVFLSVVSDKKSKKEAVRQLITKAIKGLEENDRIQSNGSHEENAKAIQVNMDSFGSLLANKFPYVSSSIPVIPLNRTSAKPLSRPRTAPQRQTKTGFHSRSTGTFPINLQPINENTENESSERKSNVPQPTKVDLQRDVQILTFEDNETPSQSKPF